MGIGQKRGPPGYLKDYIPPLGWIGIGLKVKNLYDNGNNTWLGMNNVKGEWYIGYHGTKGMNGVSGIVQYGFRRGPRQACAFNINSNPLSRNAYPFCEDGVYLTPDIFEAKKYAGLITFGGYNYKVVFMCRINPEKVRIDQFHIPEYWIVNGDQIGNPFGRKITDEVRPYRILLLK